MLIEKVECDVKLCLCISYNKVRVMLFSKAVTICNAPMIVLKNGDGAMHFIYPHTYNTNSEDSSDMN